MLIERVKAALEGATPGPWSYFKFQGVVGVSGKKADVAHCHGLGSSRTNKEVYANAALIALTPDMARRLIADEAKLIAAEEMAAKADRIANFTIGGLLADHLETREKYPHLAEAILELRAALAAYRKAGEANAD